MSDSVRSHRWQPTRLPRPWDSPGKNTGVACHVLLQCMNVKSESEVAQSCPTLSNPMDCSLLGSSIQGIFQARALEWGAIAFSYYRPLEFLFSSSLGGWVGVGWRVRLAFNWGSKDWLKMEFLAPDRGGLPYSYRICFL